MFIDMIIAINSNRKGKVKMAIMVDENGKPFAFIDEIKKITAEETHSLAEIKKHLPPCPVCGKKAYISHDLVDGYDFGYSIGCPSFKIDDGVHNFTWDSPEEDALTIHYCYSKEDAVEKWLKKVEKYDRN